MSGRLQGWLQSRQNPILWRLGNLVSDARYWWWRVVEGGKW